LKAVLFPLGERAHALQAKAAKKVGAEKAKKAETEKAKKPEKAKAATEAEAKPAKKAKQAEQSQAAAEKAKQAEMSFAAASGLAAVFGALNLNEDVRVRCLARTVQWFQELGVRRHGSRCGTARR
jgi:23S rRNA maturation mini-RNase III